MRFFKKSGKSFEKKQKAQKKKWNSAKKRKIDIPDIYIKIERQRQRQRNRHTHTHTHTHTHIQVVLWVVYFYTMLFVLLHRSDDKQLLILWSSHRCYRIDCC